MQVSNYRKLLSLRAMVVSVAAKVDSLLLAIEPVGPSNNSFCWLHPGASDVPRQKRRAHLSGMEFQFPSDRCALRARCHHWYKFRLDTIVDLFPSVGCARSLDGIKDHDDSSTSRDMLS